MQNHPLALKRLLLLTFAALLFAASASAQFKPLNETTYPQTVAAARGKVLLVNFWATWCVPCRKEMPQLVALEQKLKAKGFQLLTVSGDEPETEKAAAQFADKFSLPQPRYLKRPANEDRFHALIDPKWTGELPALVLYDRTGKKVRAYFGETDMKVLEAAIARLL
jgi:thiol-disulfide isomerase/thioredoxin